MANKLKRHNYCISDDMLARLKKEQEKTGASVAEIIRRAIDCYLTEREKQ